MTVGTAQGPRNARRWYPDRRARGIGRSLSPEWRERLAPTRITPNNAATPVPSELLRRGAAAIHDERGRQVQIDR